MGCENSCVNEHRIKSLEDDFRAFKENNSKDHKEFYNRIEDNEKAKVESTIDRKHINEKLDKIDVNVEALMQKPVKRYDSVVTGIITAVIGALVGFLLSGVIPM